MSFDDYDVIQDENGQDCCDAGVREGEICLYPNMPWLHETIGSQLERQLTQYKKGQCRNCGKPIQDVNRFCTDECKKQYQDTFDIRIKIGKHDLRRRGFD